MTGNGAGNGARSGYALGWLLRRYRTAAGLTQEELAHQAGLSVRALSNLENGRTTRPFPSSVRLLADALALGAPARAQLMESLTAIRADEAAADIPPVSFQDGVGPPPVVPRQLPAPVSQFAGRAAELRRLNRLLEHAVGSGAVVISAIGGTAGVGKTALAVHWAHQVSARFPDGQLYANLRGFDPSGTPVLPAEVIQQFLGALGVFAERMPSSPEVREGLYRSLLADRRMLIVLDNARDAAQVQPLLPGGAACLVVVTSRSQLAGLVVGQGACPVTLDVFDEAEAGEFLAQRLGPDRIADDVSMVTEVARLCGRLPLALAIAAARAALRPGMSLAAVAAELGEADARLDALDGGEAASSVRAVFSWSYHSLNESTARMFRLLSVHPGPDITVRAAASLADIPAHQASRALTELVAAHLAAQPGPGRFALHDLLRAYAAEQAHTCESDADRATATRRVLDHYLHAACAATLLLDPADAPIKLAPAESEVRVDQLADHGQALDWFDAEHKVLVAISLSAAENGFDAHAMQLPHALTEFLLRRGHWNDCTATQLAALAAAQRLGDAAGQARAHHDIGRACLAGGALDDARCQLGQAIDMARQLGDDASEGASRLLLASALVRQGRLADGLGQARQALELSQTAGDRIGEAKALNSAGWDYAQLGDFERGLSYCSRALALCQELGLRTNEAATADSLGFAHHQLGQHDEAASWYAHASDLYEQLGDRYRQALTQTSLGNAQQAARDEQSARQNWQQALAILDDLQHPDATALRAKLRTTPAA